MLSLGILLIIILITLIPMIIFRGRIKLLLYVHFNWRPFSRNDDDDVTDKVYDVFVSHSGLDYQWVVHVLRPHLEPRYKLCLHDRDFRVGAPIEDNIMESVTNSRRLLMVLSNNFLRSEWCKLEFRAAHYICLREKVI